MKVLLMNAKGIREVRLPRYVPNDGQSSSPGVNGMHPIYPR
jgi:hypothetical protein